MGLASASWPRTAHGNGDKSWRALTVVPVAANRRQRNKRLGLMLFRLATAEMFHFGLLHHKDQQELYPERTTRRSPAYGYVQTNGATRLCRILRRGGNQRARRDPNDTAINKSKKPQLSPGVYQ